MKKIHNMASCMLSILDYLKLQDSCKPGEDDMLKLNDETLSEMMFRKMEAHGIDLNKELNFTHLKPVKKNKSYKFNVDDERFYEFNKPEKKEKTRSRLEQMAKIGLEEVGLAEFGYKDLMSGLYIESVWSHSDEDFEKYIDWAKTLILEKKKKT